ncbi:MAG: efflux RND transporter periplasmic adaptor subunit [Ferruginibacter sp.]
MKTTMKNSLTITAGFIITCFMFSSCKVKNADAAVTTKGPIISDSTMQLLKIDTVLNKDVDDEVKLTGEVSFNDNKVVKVFPFSSGQVLSVNVSIGDYAKAGQTLATIKSADIAGNYADLSVAGNDEAIAKRSMENAEHLYKNGIASEKEFIEAKENYSKAVSSANKIKEQIQINGGGHTSANGIYVVSAPRSGYVVEKLINPGNFIRNDNNSNMFTIGDISDVWIWANVFETDVAKVKAGYEAKVTTVAYPDTVFIGKVDKVNETLDPVTKVMKVKIVLQNKSGLLKPEMFADVLISNSENKKAPAVPSAAIISENGKDYVVVFNNPNDVKVQEVNILKTTGNYTFINSGVTPGQKVITQNQILVYRMLTEK